jgi:hypothetical protein
MVRAGEFAHATAHHGLDWAALDQMMIINGSWMMDFNHSAGEWSRHAVTGIRNEAGRRKRGRFSRQGSSRLPEAFPTEPGKGRAGGQSGAGAK